MKGFTAVLRRELAARRLVWSAALLAAILPFLVPIARGMSGLPAREARETLAAILAAGFAAALSAALGWSAVSRDFADGRIAFDFARPLSAGAIWAGRLGAAFALAAGAAGVIWLPTFAASRGRTVLAALPLWSPWSLAGPAALLVAVVTGSALLVILAHASAIALRSRSALLLVDAAAAAGAALAILAASRLLRLHAAGAPLRLGLLGAGASIAAGTAAGAAAAVLRGRREFRAAHRAMSPWIWGGLALAAAGLGASALWVGASTPRDLAALGASPAPRGPWVGVAGRARGGEAGFLLDASSGRFLRAGAARPGNGWWELPAFSKDGRVAAWFEPAGDPAPWELVVAKLTADPVRPTRAGFTWPVQPYNVGLSSDGALAAISDFGGLTVIAVATGRTVGSARLFDSGDGSPVAGRFLENGRFRAFRWGTARIDVVDFDATSRRVIPVCSISGLNGWSSFRFDPAHDRILVREASGTRLRLFDAKSGRPIATLFEGPPQTSGWPVFLSDGRIVYAAADDAATRLRVFDAEGRPVRSLEVPPPSRVYLGGEVAPGKIAVATVRDADPAVEGGALYLADVDAGTVRKVADGLRPAVWYPFFDELPVGSDATKLFRGPGASLVRFDPITGERRVLAGGRGGR